MRDGELLKAAIDTSNYQVNDVLKTMGVSRGQLYNLYKQETIKPEYRKRAERLKLKIDWNESKNSEVKFLREQVALLTKSNQDLIEILKKK